MISPVHRRIPARARPFIRLGTVALLVILADAATEQLTRHGGTVGFPAVTAVRILTAPLILRYPLAGFVLSLEIDKWDWYWLGMGDQSAARQEIYQHWDKAVDLVCLGVAAVTVLRWPDVRARTLTIGALTWRVIGVAAFFATEQRWLLIIFPNVFESLFLLYLIFRILSGHQQMLYGTKATVLVTLAVLIPKVAAEVFLHALNDRPWHSFHLLPGNMAILDAWLWGAALYALPLIALVALVATARGRATHGDPEDQVSAV